MSIKQLINRDKMLDQISLDANLVIDNVNGHLFKKLHTGLWECSCKVRMRKESHLLGFRVQYFNGSFWTSTNPKHKG
jgi:hypothetical protein